MLLFTLKPDEAIAIGDGITVTLVESEDGQVQLGVNAPSGMVVLKEDVYRRIIESGKGELVTQKIKVA